MQTTKPRSTELPTGPSAPGSRSSAGSSDAGPAANPIPEAYVASLRQIAARFEGRCESEMWISEILAYLIEHDDRIYRALCERARDPGDALREALGPLYS